MDINNDDRKVYFTNITAEFLGISQKDNTLRNIADDESLSKFLNDVACSLFWIASLDGTYKCSNEVR